MRIVGTDAMALRAPGRGREFYLPAGMGLEDLLGVLAAQEVDEGEMPEDCGPSPDGKSEHQVYFWADGELCGFWDYRGERWSAFGPRPVFEALGLMDYSRL